MPFAKSAQNPKTRGAYFTWCDMRKRCLLPSHKNYGRYGGRGITICDRWNSFDNFFADMGEKPKGLTIERIDVNGNYYPENCKWASRKEQNKNRNSNVKITFNGITKIVSEWADELGISKFCIRYRLKAGWSIERALTTKTQRKNHE